MLHRINSVGIQQRLLLLAILPVVITTMLLGYYVITSRIDDINSKLLDRGRDFAKHVAPSVDLAITARNRDILRSIVDRALQEDDVVRIGIYDEAGKLLLEKRADLDLERGEVFTFSEAIIQTSIEVNADADLIGEGGSSVFLTEKKVGEVEVELSNLKTKEEEKVILINSFLIMASGLLLSAILALRIGGTVANPIIHLTRAMKLLRSGNFDARVQVVAEGELGTLQSGFNGMAETLQESQKGLQQQVDKATKELRDIVAELEKKNSELEGARQEALQAGQAKLNFLAKMSHEIRTPVNAIIGFARLLENIIEQDGALEYTRTINQASKQLLCVIDDILDFSKIEYGTLSFENIPFNLRDMIEDVVVMQRPAAYEKKLELIFNYFSDVPDDVFGDSARISQVLGNLLNNAVKFTEHGSIIVQVEVTERKVGEYSRFLISVIDNGIGIGKGEQEKLFKAFSQVDTTIRRRFGGTGLGLVIARRIVENMGGEIGVESEKGNGSRFWFSLTLQEKTRQDEIRNEDAFSNKQIIVVEKNPLTRRSMRNLLVQWGFQVLSKSGVETLGELDDIDSSISCLILSLSLEELEPDNMLLLITKLRDLYRGPLLIMIAREECVLPSSLQVDDKIDCLTKPARRKTLFKTIERLMGAVSKYDVERIAGNNTKRNYQGFRILVAEDNPFNKTLIGTLLGQMNIDVVEASTGKEAIEQYLKEDVDMILMDIHMPEMDGLEATRQIRIIDAGVKKPPIIALTADVFIQDRDNLEASGLDGYLIKPISESKLEMVLDKYFSRAGVGGVETGGSHVDRKLVLSRELRERLYDDMQSTLIDIKCYLDSRGTQEGLANATHTFFGLVGYYEITSLYEMAKMLDSLVKEQKYDDASEFFKDIEEEVKSFIENNKS